MHREHLLPSRSSRSPSREGFVTFQALLGLESTFKDTNTEGSSKDMTAGIQRLPLDLHHLQWSAMQGRFLHGLPMAFKRPKFAEMGTCQTPSCTWSCSGVIGGAYIQKADGLVSKIVWMMPSALLPWTGCEKSGKLRHWWTLAIGLTFLSLEGCPCISPVLRSTDLQICLFVSPALRHFWCRWLHQGRCRWSVIPDTFSQWRLMVTFMA